METDWTILGTYLGRTIKAAAVTQIPVRGYRDLTTATVLLTFSRDYTTSQIGKEILRSVITACPVAIAVAGIGSGASFDDLLKTASSCSDSRHIMTAHLEEASVDDLAESFLFGVMPAEERYSEWTFSGILIVEDSGGYYDRMVGAISKWTDKSEIDGDSG